MKRIYRILMFFSALALLPAMNVHAQRIGLEGSYVADILSQKDGGKTKTNLLNGWNALFTYEHSLGGDSSNWALNVGLGWEMRANRYGVEWYEPYTTCTRFLHYVQVPVDVEYFIPLDRKHKLRLYFYGGPRLSVGVLGDYAHHYYMATRPYDKKNPFGSSFAGDSMQRFDVSFGVGFGIEYYGAYLKVGYDFPLMNSIRNEYAPDKLYQHNVKVSMGYKFDLKPIIKRKRENRINGLRRPKRQRFGTMALPEDKPIKDMDKRVDLKR